MKTLIPLADGVEEMEAVIITDVLRRADWPVTTAGIAPGEVTASRGVRITPDALWEDVYQQDYDLLVIPGGIEGVQRLCETMSVLDTVRRFQRQNRWLAAICAGPLVLDKAGVLDGRRITSHPAVASRIESVPVEASAVVREGRLLTSQGPGSAMRFALALVACESAETAEALAEAMVCAPEVRETLNGLSTS